MFSLLFSFPRWLDFLHSQPQDHFSSLPMVSIGTISPTPVVTGSSHTDGMYSQATGLGSRPDLTLPMAELHTCVSQFHKLTSKTEAMTFPQVISLLRFQEFMTSPSPSLFLSHLSPLHCQGHLFESKYVKQSKSE